MNYLFNRGFIPCTSSKVAYFSVVSSLFSSETNDHYSNIDLCISKSHYRLIETDYMWLNDFYDQYKSFHKYVLAKLDDDYMYLIYVSIGGSVIVRCYMERTAFTSNYETMVETIFQNALCDEEIASRDKLRFDLLYLKKDDIIKKGIKDIILDIPKNNPLKGSYAKSLKDKTVYKYNRNVNPFINDQYPQYSSDFLDLDRKPIRILKGTNPHPFIDRGFIEGPYRGKINKRKGKRGFSTNSVSLSSVYKRSYSLSSRLKNKSDGGIESVVGIKNRFITDVLSSIEKNLDPSNDFVNRAMEIKLEQLVSDELKFQADSKGFTIDGISSTVLNPKISKYLFDKEDSLNLYISNLEKYLKCDSGMASKFMLDIVVTLGRGHILNMCYTSFLAIMSFQTSEFEDKNKLVAVAIKLSKRMLFKYWSILRSNYCKQNGDISYTEWLSKWEADNPQFLAIIGDTFHANLGARVIEILESCGMIYKDMVTIAYNNKQYFIRGTEEACKNVVIKNKILNLPSKLPMLAEPKAYSKGVLGGYLLNDIDFKEDLFIHKNAYDIKTSLSDDNKIYSMINNISSTPFKVNTDLLEYLTLDKHKLLYQQDVKHKFHDIQKRTRYQDVTYKAHVSKVLLEQAILDICHFYKKFSNIYFPVRLDQRGRIYCSPIYFNYQSTELAKALILFSNPGLINRSDTSSINYLKIYGATSFGGALSKQSGLTKIDWVDKNVDNILNFDNGVLLHKAKDKFLFLAFCMEYSRYYKFFTNENLNTFKTYLPVQLDATCNGFQHMALLSNEKSLFKELNLHIDPKDKDKDKPKDFYNFLLHKLIKLFDDNSSGIESEDKGSYDRLSKFVWNRLYVKKAIMTIPYNSSTKTMTKYITDNLEPLNDIDKDHTVVWYQELNCSKSTSKINSKDVYLLVESIKNIINKDFEKISKLSKYLVNICKVLNSLGLPILWTLPTGLIIKQSYLKTKTTVITPFTHSKAKINLKTTLKGQYDTNKQVIALMPNLIHSLDATSLSLLSTNFYRQSENTQFYSIHDCFGTTCDKVFLLKTVLASVYTDLYSNDSYLKKFDDTMLSHIESSVDYNFDKKNRKIFLEKQTLRLHDINWVLNKTTVSKSDIKKIDAQHILV